MVRTASDAQAALDAAHKVVETHRRLSTFLRHGMTLAQIDRFVAQTIADLGGKSCFYGYQIPRSPKFPSHACLSLNECVVHGTAGYYTLPLKPGDVLKIDIGIAYHGWNGDAAWTYVFGDPSPHVKRLMDCGKESLRRGVQALRPGNTYLAWAQAVQGHVEGECGFHLIRGLGGHGLAPGKKFHAEPFISNTLPTHPSEWPDASTPCRPGTLVAVEPMIAVGTGRTRTIGNEWPVFTADGSLSVHYEHDVLITDSGPRVLTAGLEEVGDVVTA
jgi:methionyl aminopeptidase